MEVEVDTILQVDGVGTDGALGSVGTHFGHDAFVNGTWEYETTVVVGVLTNEVNTTRRGIDVAGLAIEVLDEATSYEFNVRKLKIGFVIIKNQLLLRMVLFVDAELVDGLLTIFLTWAKDDAWEVRMVRRVGEVLALEADA